MFSCDGLVGKTIVAVKSNEDKRGLYSDVYFVCADGSAAQIGATKEGFLVCVMEEPNDQAERLAVNARKLETETAKPTQAAEPQASSQFDPAPLLGVTSSSRHGTTVSNESLPRHQIRASSVDKLTWRLLQKSPSRCSVLFYYILAVGFSWRHRVSECLQNLERRTNTYCEFSRSYIVVQDVFGGLPRRVMITPNDQAERLAVNARKLETETAKPTQAAEPQASSQFDPAPLLGDTWQPVFLNLSEIFPQWIPQQSAWLSDKTHAQS